MQNAQRKAREFMKEQELKGKITSSDLIRVAQDLGFSVFYYSGSKNLADVQSVLDAIGMADYAKTKSAFTYEDDNRKIIFIKYHQTQKEQTLLLAHELGHIYLGHYQSSGVFGGNTTKENEANEFARCVVNSERNRAKSWWIGGMSAVAAIAIGLGAYGYLHKLPDAEPAPQSTPAVTQQTTPTPEPQQATPEQPNANGSVMVYRTPSGDKYHRADCQYVKYNTNTTGITLEQAKEDGLAPCKECKPEK